MTLQSEFNIPEALRSPSNFEVAVMELNDIERLHTRVSPPSSFFPPLGTGNRSSQNIKEIIAGDSGGR